MKKTSLILIALAVVLVLWAFTGYNSLVGLNENVDAQWAKVETQYQRRLDLVPNLVASVQGIFNQEKTLITAVTEARGRYVNAETPDEKAAAASEVEGALGRLLVVVENYPQVASSQNVRDLMTQLEGTENRISVERTRFNDEVRVYNTTIKRFPKNILASLLGFGERHYFEAADGAEVAPTVNLN